MPGRRVIELFHVSQGRDEAHWEEAKGRPISGCQGENTACRDTQGCLAAQRRLIPRGVQTQGVQSCCDERESYGIGEQRVRCEGFECPFQWRGFCVCVLVACHLSSILQTNTCWQSPAFLGECCVQKLLEGQGLRPSSSISPRTGQGHVLELPIAMVLLVPASAFDQT